MFNSSKAQASVEFIVIVIIGLLLVSIVVFFLFSQKSSLSSRSEIDTAQLAVNDIAKAADDVLIQGAGSVKKIQVTVPESTDINASGIEGKSIFLSLQGTRVFSKSKALLSGSFPKEKGKQIVSVNARADYVFIGTSKVSVNKYSFFITIPQGNTVNDLVVLKNESNDVLSVSIGKDWNSTIVFFEATPTSFSLQPLESKTVSLTLTSMPLMLGVSSGRLNFSISGNDYFEMLSLPLSVEVKSSKTSTGSLRIIPSFWSVSLKPGSSELKVFKLCNQSNLPLSIVSFFKDEVFSKELPKTDGGIVWSVFADKNYIYAGMQDGSINVWMSDLTFFKKLFETQSPMRSIVSDSEFLYAGSADGRIFVFKKGDFSLQKTLKISSGIMGLAVDEDFLYGVSSNGFVFIWRKNDFSLVKSFSSSVEALSSIAVDSSNIYVGGIDGNITVWDKTSFGFKARLSEPLMPVNSVSVSNGFLFAGTQDGKVFVYTTENFSLNKVISKGFNSVKQLFANSNQGYLAVAAADSGIHFFSIPEFFETFNSSAGTFMQSVSGSEELVFFGTEDSEVYALKYTDIASKIASYWVEGLNEVQAIPADSCIDKNLQITIPPFTVQSTFSGTISVNAGSFGSDVLQLQAIVK